MITLRVWDVSTGKPLPGSAIANGNQLTADEPVLEAMIRRGMARGYTAEATAASIDGYSNGYVSYASAPPPVASRRRSWDDEAVRFDPHEARDARGKWVRHGAAAPAGPVAGPNAPAAAGQREPTVRELASMVDGLAKQLETQRAAMESGHKAELRNVVTEMRHEQDRLIRLAQRTQEAGKSSEETRNELIRAVVTVLALVAVGLLVIATAGAALPPVAAAAIATGPLIGAEIIHAIRKEHQASGKRLGKRLRA